MEAFFVDMKSLFWILAGVSAWVLFCRFSWRFLD